MKISYALILGLFCASNANAAAMQVQMYKINLTDGRQVVGTVKIEDTQYGLLLTPHLHGLNPGLHGFHVHENPSCKPGKDNHGQIAAGHGAGGHYDPQGTKKHAGPYGTGHLGDLPPLYFDSHGKATLPVLAPRLKTYDIKDRALIVHSGGDNYSDSPQKLGGGVSRKICGIIK